MLVRREGAQAPATCKQLRVEHIHSLVVPGVFALEVHRVQNILDEDGKHHGHQNGILEGGIGDGVSHSLPCSSQAQASRQQVQ